MTKRVAAFEVIGMHCPSCAKRLEAVVRAAPGVAGARVDFLRATLTVDANDEGPAPEPTALIARADEAGFIMKLAR